MRIPAKVSDTVIQMTELVLPQHTNQLGNLLGGQLMHWIDICAALSGYKLNGHVCVTASVDRIDFHYPISQGGVVTLISSVNRVFNTSMEIGVKVFIESWPERTRRHSNSAYLTFVCVDEQGKPMKARLVEPVTDDEVRRYEEALQRRNRRLKGL